MALLPEQINALPIDTTIEYVDFPSLTWYIDPITRHITRMCDGREAIKQTIEEILSVARFKFSIFTPNHGMDYDRLVGSNWGYVVPELKRRLLDAFRPDNRITGLSDFKLDQVGLDSLRCDFLVHTVYGEVAHSMEVDGTR